METEKNGSQGGGARYRLRKVNILDLRTVSRIFKEAGMSESSVAAVFKNVFAAADNVIKGQNPKAAAIAGDVADALAAGASEAAVDGGGTVPDGTAAAAGGTGALVDALIPALFFLVDLFAENQAFWDFTASLLSVDYEGLGEIGLFDDTAAIVTELLSDPQFAGFFRFASRLRKRKAKPEDSEDSTKAA